MQRAPPNLPHPALLHGPLRLLALLLKPFSDEHQERHFERQFSYRTAVVLVRLPYQIRDRSMHFSVYYQPRHVTEDRTVSLALHSTAK